MQVKIINLSENPLPKYETEGSAGMDLRANIKNPIRLVPGDRALVPAGIRIELPPGYEARVQPRSGLAIKHGITVLNSPGCVDSDFRGEVGVILINHSREDFTVRPGDRIAQMVVSRHEHVEWLEVDELSDTDRGGGGFGHTDETNK